MNRQLTAMNRWFAVRFKRLLYIGLCACACILTAFSCHKIDGPGMEGKELRHTVIFYIAGENSLSQFVATDSAEIARAADALGDDVRVVMFIDDAKSSRLCVKTKNEQMTTVRRYYENVWSTDSASMLHVLQDIVLAYPSKSYGLVCWSHATGWLFSDSVSEQSAVKASDGNVPMRRAAKRRSFGIDNGMRLAYSDNGSSLDIPAMAGLMAQLPKFEYVLFDACFMQCVEVAYELRNVCNWVIGSPAEIPGDGAPYHLVLSLLCADPFNAEAVVDAYHRYYDSGDGYFEYRGVELSAVNTAGLDAFAAATREAVGLIWGDRKEADVTNVQYYTTRLYYPHFYDMESLFYHNLPEEAFTRWRNALAGALPYIRLSNQWTTSSLWAQFYTLFDREHCCAMSIFAPIESTEEKWNVPYRRLEWYKAAGLDQTGW